MYLETIHYFEGINVTFLEIIHQFIIIQQGRVKPNFQIPSSIIASVQQQFEYQYSY